MITLAIVLGYLFAGVSYSAKNPNLIVILIWPLLQSDRYPIYEGRARAVAYSLLDIITRWGLGSLFLWACFYCAVLITSSLLYQIILSLLFMAIGGLVAIPVMVILGVPFMLILGIFVDLIFPKKIAK